VTCAGDRRNAGGRRNARRDDALHARSATDLARGREDRLWAALVSRSFGDWAGDRARTAADQGDEQRGTDGDEEAPT